MKIISLNIWGGCVGESFLDFFRKYQDTDIFLLQEVYHNATDITAWEDIDRRQVFREISERLPHHQGFFAPAESNEWGLAAFVHTSIKIDDHGDVFVHRHRDGLVGRDGSTLGKNLQYLTLMHAGSPWTVLNFHGLWTGKDKHDTSDRLNQSKKIIEFAKKIPHNIILAGDFNLRPDTESLKLLEKNLNLKNLITEHGITSTRTSLYTKPERFADYVLISPRASVQAFKVLPDEVSDHAPLFVEF